MPIYQKGISSFSKLADIYLKNTTNFTRICKVYICTGANTFQLVYNGCDVCNCETFCDVWCAGNCYCPCVYHATAPDTSNWGHNNYIQNNSNFTVTFICGCGSTTPPTNWAGDFPTSSECTSDPCNDATCTYPGCFSNTFWIPCQTNGWTPGGGGGNCDPSYADCPTGGPTNEGGNWDGPVIDGGTIDIGGNNYQRNVYYYCRTSCCPEPNNGYSSCLDSLEGALTTGDLCCNSRYYDTGIANYKCTSGNSPCECDTTFICATP